MGNKASKASKGIPAKIMIVRYAEKPGAYSDNADHTEDAVDLPLNRRDPFWHGSDIESNTPRQVKQ